MMHGSTFVLGHVNAFFRSLQITHKLTAVKQAEFTEMPHSVAT